MEISGMLKKTIQKKKNEKNHLAALIYLVKFLKQHFFGVSKASIVFS